MVFWMLISETVICDMLTKALTPNSQATAELVTIASQVTGGYGHAEVDPPAAGNDAIDNCRFEEVSDDHLRPVHQLLRGFAVDARKTDIQAGLKKVWPSIVSRSTWASTATSGGSLTFVQAATILIADRW